jgi:hypothetical protein
MQTGTCKHGVAILWERLNEVTTSGYIELGHARQILLDAWGLGRERLVGMCYLGLRCATVC